MISVHSMVESPLPPPLEMPETGIVTGMTPAGVAEAIMANELPSGAE
jgi:hypothetical protein